MLLGMSDPAADTPSDTAAIQPDSMRSAADSAPDTPDSAAALDFRILELRRAGTPYRNIAALCGCSPARVQRTIKRAVRTAVSELGTPGITREEITRRIFELAPSSLSRIAELRRSKKDDVALRASADLLDRAGFAPVQKQLTMHAVEEMDRTQLASAISALLSRLAGSSPAPAVPAAYKEAPPAVPCGDASALPAPQAHLPGSLPAAPVGTEAPGGATAAESDQGNRVQTSVEKSILQVQEETGETPT